jgi:hypothetical protein
MKKGFPYIIIIILTVIIVYLTKCSKDDVITNTVTVSDTSYVHDTLEVIGKTKIKPVPVPYYVHDTIIDSTGKTVVVETKKYLTNDTFEYKTDSFTATFYTKIYSECPLDSIKSNLIATIRHKIIETTITKEIIRKNAFFVGPSVGIGKTSSISLDGLYERNGKNIYRLGVGVNSRFEPVIKAGIYWQISK